MRIGLRTAVEEPSWKCTTWTACCRLYALMPRSGAWKASRIRWFNLLVSERSSEACRCCCLRAARVRWGRLQRWLGVLVDRGDRTPGTRLALLRAVQVDLEAVEGVCSTAGLLEAVARRASRDSRFWIRVSQSSEPYIISTEQIVQTVMHNYSVNL